MLVLTLSVNFVLSFGGFLIMLVSALTVERNTRRMGKAGLDQITQSMRAVGPARLLRQHQREDARPLQARRVAAQDSGSVGPLSAPAPMSRRPSS